MRIGGLETALREWMEEGVMTEWPWKKAEKRDCARERRVLWGGGIAEFRWRSGCNTVMHFGEKLPRSCGYQLRYPGALSHILYGEERCEEHNTDVDLSSRPCCRPGTTTRVVDVTIKITYKAVVAIDINSSFRFSTNQSYEPSPLS